jgi:hypothetical protein
MSPTHTFTYRVYVYIACGMALDGVACARSRIHSLQGQESKLEEITKKQGIDTHSFVTLVKENQTVLDGLQVGTRALYVHRVTQVEIKRACAIENK